MRAGARFLGVKLVRLDDPLDQLVADHVASVNSTNAIPSIEPSISLHRDQAGRLVARQVDLRHVAGDHHLRPEAEPREEHLHLLGLVFCASSRMMNESFNVRPRMNASGATSIMPCSM